MKVVHKKDFVKQSPEVISKVDIVDRSGYVPLDIKYWEMLSAGANLANLRTLNYGYDRKAVFEAIDSVGLEEAISSTSLRTPYLDKQQADTLLKNKISKYKDIKSKHERLEELKRKYFFEINQKNREEEIINKYKEQEKMNNT